MISIPCAIGLVALIVLSGVILVLSTKPVRELPVKPSYRLKPGYGRMKGDQSVLAHFAYGTGKPIEGDPYKHIARSLYAERRGADEIEARLECARRGIDPDALCADDGTEAWEIVAKELRDRRTAEHNDVWRTTTN